MAKLYRTDTTLQDILNMKVGDELKLSGGDLPDYTEEDAGKALVVNQSGTGLEWGSELPTYNSSDVGKVLTVGTETEAQTETTTGPIVPEQSVNTEQSIELSNVIFPDEFVSKSWTMEIDGNAVTANGRTIGEDYAITYSEGFSSTDKEYTIILYEGGRATLTVKYVKTGLPFMFIGTIAVTDVITGSRYTFTTNTIIGWKKGAIPICDFELTINDDYSTSPTYSELLDIVRNIDETKTTQMCLLRALDDETVISGYSYTNGSFIFQAAQFIHNESPKRLTLSLTDSGLNTIKSETLQADLSSGYISWETDGN